MHICAWMTHKIHIWRRKIFSLHHSDAQVVYTIHRLSFTSLHVDHRAKNIFSSVIKKKKKSIIAEQTGCKKLTEFFPLAETTSFTRACAYPQNMVTALVPANKTSFRREESGSRTKWPLNLHHKMWAWMMEMLLHNMDVIGKRTTLVTGVCDKTRNAQKTGGRKINSN